MEDKNLKLHTGDLDPDPVTEKETEPVTLPGIASQCGKDEYLVKTIEWKDKTIRIITQNGKKKKKYPPLNLHNV